MSTDPRVIVVGVAREYCGFELKCIGMLRCNVTEAAVGRAARIRR